MLTLMSDTEYSEVQLSSNTTVFVCAQRKGAKLKCMACRILMHAGCLERLKEVRRRTLLHSLCGTLAPLRGHFGGGGALRWVGRGISVGGHLEARVQTQGH